MKRWLWFSAAALLAFSGCDDKDGQAHRVLRRPEPLVSSSRSRGEPQGELDRFVPADSARRLAQAASAPSDEASAGAGARFFDGAALLDAGFAGSVSGAVYAGDGGEAARRVSLSYAGPAPRAATDLSAPEPPLPEGALYPSASLSAARGAGAVLAAFDRFQRRMFETAAPIISRVGWGAAGRKGRAVAMEPTHVTIHHTGGAQTMTETATMAQVRAIQRYHMHGRAKEGKDVWEDIGYHFLIDGAGRVIEGRPAETLGAHVAGGNSRNIGIAMMGNFQKVKPTAAQIESLTRLVSFLALKYRQDPARRGFLEGHRHYNDTDCPGKNMMTVLSALRARIDAETAELAARVKGAPKGEFVPVLTHA